MNDSLVFAIPSKGRLMEQATEYLGSCGLSVRKVGHERGYRGVIDGIGGVEVAYVSASEIAEQLKSGRAHLGITGEDLVREQFIEPAGRIASLKALGFGQADVVVAVPEAWLDVWRMADIEEVAIDFRRVHGRRLRVATKYTNLTRRFFARKGVTSYRIIESVGATEGTVAAGLAELVVDITTTGATLKANGLRVLDDGVILQSQANLFASRSAPWTPAAREAENAIIARLGI